MKVAALLLVAAAAGGLAGLCATMSLPAGTYIATLPDRTCPKAAGGLTLPCSTPSHTSSRRAAVVAADFFGYHMSRALMRQQPTLELPSSHHVHVTLHRTLRDSAGNLDGQTCSTRPNTVGLANYTLAQQKWKISGPADPRYRKIQNLSRRSCASTRASWLVAPTRCGRAGARQLAALSRSEDATAATDPLFEVVCSELDAAGYLPCYFKAKSGEAKSATLWRLYSEDTPRPSESGLAYVGADVGSVPSVPSAAACKALCSAHAGCYFFTYVPSRKNTCFLKSKCGWRKQAQAGTISGPDLGSIPAMAPVC
ncbi:hypothetical protein ABPG75_010867 [Micractinium tetrahymenae]